MSGTNPEVAGNGVMTGAISSSMVGLLHRYTGRGPTRARTTIDQNVIVCVMGATLTKAEQSLVRDGKHEVVLHSRRAFQETMKADAIASVQNLSGRRVVAFLSNNHIDPDLAVEVFVLAPVGSDSPMDPSSGGQTLALDGHRSALDGHRSALDGHRSALDGHRSALDGHRSLS